MRHRQEWCPGSRSDIGRRKWTNRCGCLDSRKSHKRVCRRLGSQTNGKWWRKSYRKWEVERCRSSRWKGQPGVEIRWIRKLMRWGRYSCSWRIDSLCPFGKSSDRRYVS